MSQPLLRHLVHALVQAAADRSRLDLLTRSARRVALLPHTAGPGQPLAAGTETVLSAYRRRWLATLHRLTRSALGRLTATAAPLQAAALFEPAERQHLAATLADTTAAADLLGRSRVRRQWGRVLPSAPRPAPEPTELPVVPHQRAVDYFRRLVPTLGVEPRRHAETHARQAFTLAVATEQTLLRKVKGVIERRLETGQFSGGAREVRRVLDEAGVGPGNRTYADLVWRTNVLDSLNVGAQEELQAPEVQTVFPVWLYSGILDGREGDDHRPHFGKYYPASVPFTAVRDSLVVKAGQVVKAGPGEGRPFNCRCTMIPTDKWRWAELQAQGVTVEPWPQ